jgi:glycosyltransferase involved in cell wall biosynthesis
MTVRLESLQSLRPTPPVGEEAETLPAVIRIPTIQPRSGPRHRPRALLVVPNLLIGGVEHWLLGVIKYSLDQIDWSVAVTNPAAVEPEMRQRVAAFAEVATSDEEIARLLRQADVVVTWGIADPIRRIGCYSGPVILVSHGCCEWTRQFITACQGLSTHFVAVSEAATGPFGGLPVTVIPNGIDLDRCRPVQKREDVRNAWGLAEGEIAVGFVGRISPEKNPLATAQAVSALGSGFRAVYIGKGYGVDLRPAVLELTSNAIFVKPTYQIGDVLHALDCLIMASPNEGFSMALIEAMLAGVPVVATRVGVVPDLETKCGLRLTTVPIHPSPTELASAVRAAISPEKRSLIEKARQTVLRDYTADTMGKKWADYIMAIIGG